jgi:hypothetical protein
MRWLIAAYQPVGLFSLKHGEATSTGGKSLLVPTPFAIRTALLDAAIRVKGVDYGPQAFEYISSLYLAVRPPEWVVVTNLFAKVLKPERDSERGRAMQQTIAFREYVYLGGTLELAAGGKPPALEAVASLVPHVTSFGKRGSLFQLMEPPQMTDELPDGFTALDGVYVKGNRVKGNLPPAFASGLIQMMDDWGESLTFSKINIYSNEKIDLGSDRIRKGVILPYRLVRSGKGFTQYQRI